MLGFDKEPQEWLRPGWPCESRVSGCSQSPVKVSPR